MLVKSTLLKVGAALMSMGSFKLWRKQKRLEDWERAEQRSVRLGILASQSAAAFCSEYIHFPNYSLLSLESRPYHRAERPCVLLGSMRNVSYPETAHLAYVLPCHVIVLRLAGLS